MRHWLIGAVLCASVGSSAVTMPAWSGESVYVEGDLYKALADAIPPDDAEQKLDRIFEQFLGAEKSLQEKASILEENGFDCKTEQSSLIEENATLSCRRPVTGATSCIGLRYFSYQTAEGQTIEAIGDSYVAKKDIWGRCVY